MGAETKNESEMTHSWLLLMVCGCRDKSKVHQQVFLTCWWWLWSSVLRQRCWEGVRPTNESKQLVGGGCGEVVLVVVASRDG